jgi:hypothetical protein
MFTQNQLDLILNKLCPLGKVPKYADGAITLSDTTVRRFIHDGYYVRRLPRGECLVDKGAYNPEYLGFGVNEAISCILQDDYALYLKLYDDFKYFDFLASTYIESTEQSAVLFNHKSFGQRVFPHIHQRNETNKPTVSLFYNLTKTSKEKPILTLMEPVFPGDKEFERGYSNHKLLLVHERNSAKQDIEIDNGIAVVFDAQNIPHSMTFTDDIWLVFVYDNVTLKTVPDNYMQLFNSRLYYNVFPVTT